MSLLRWGKADSAAPASTQASTLPAVSASSPATLQSVPHIERALITLTTKMQSCDQRLHDIERRLDELADNVEHAPSHSDVLEVRIHSAKLAAELARSTVELRGEIGMASDEARRAARLARSTEHDEVPVALPVDLDLTTEEHRRNWSESA